LTVVCAEDQNKRALGISGLAIMRSQVPESPIEAKVAESPATPEFEEIAKELSEFRRSALLLSEASAHLIDTHDKQWVAVLNGEVKAQAGDVDGLFIDMASKNVDPRYALVRHIQRNQRTLIL
jgi:hypothetical protein